MRRPVPTIVVLATILLNACASDSGSDAGRDPAAVAPPAFEPEISVEERETVTRVVDALDGFLRRNDIPAGAVAVGHEGRRIGSGGIGRTAGEPAPLASLSKAITAVCTVETLANAGVPLSSPIGTLLADLFERTDVADARLADITVAQLIGHDSGLRDDHVIRHYRRFGMFDEEQQEAQFATIASVELVGEPGSGYRYSNANYLILGLVIEAVGGRPHDEACLDTVLRPAGVDSASLSRDWRSESSFGGWELSASDHLAFADTWFRGATVARLELATREVETTVNDDTSYGLGVLMRPSGSSVNRWHDGSFLWDDGTVRASYGAFFAAFANGYTVSLNYARDAGDGRGAEIDGLVFDAVHTPAGASATGR